MSYYVYEKTSAKKLLLKAIIIAVVMTSLVTGIVVAKGFSGKIGSLESTIESMKEKEIYYKEIETQFFEDKAVGYSIEEYERRLEAKDSFARMEIQDKEDQIIALSDYVDQISDHAAALENTVKRVASTSDVKPQNYIIPESISRGTYDRLSRDGTTLTPDKLEYVGVWSMTVYTPSVEECGTDLGLTASGDPIEPGQTIAIDPKYWSFGQRFYIEGYGEVVAKDTGGSLVKGRNRLDYAILDKNMVASFGNQMVKVWLIKE